MSTEHSVSLRIETSQVKKAAFDLASLDNAALSAGQSLDGFGSRSAKMNERARKAAEAAERMRANIDRMEKAVRKANEEMARADGSYYGMSRAAREAERAIRQAEDAMRMTESTAGSLGSVMNTLRGIMATVGAAYLAREFLNLADQAANLEGRLRLVTSGADDLLRVQERLFAQAQASSSSYAGSVELYARLANATREYGKSQEDVLRLTDTLNKAFVVSGATATEAQNALIQLSQGFASGLLRGEEFNSIAENGQRVMMALSDSLGVGAGALRQMAEDKKLTTDTVFNALLKQADAINREFEQMPLTVERASTQLGNAWLKAVGAFDQEFDISGSIAQGMADAARIIESYDFAGAFDGLAKAAAIAGATVTTAFSPAIFDALAAAILRARDATLALNTAALANPWTAIAAAIAGAATALYIFRDDLKPIQGDLATVGDYMRVIWDGVGGAIDDAAKMAVSAWDGVVDVFSAISSQIESYLGPDLFGRLIGAFENFGSTIVAIMKSPVNTIIGVWMSAIDVIGAAWGDFPGVIAGVVTSAVNATIRAVEAMANRVIDILNTVIDAANSLPGVALSAIKEVDFSGWEIQIGDAAGAVDELGDKLKANLSTDYVGQWVDAVGKGAEALREMANERAIQRSEIEAWEQYEKGIKQTTDAVDRHRKALGAAGEAADKAGKKGRGAARSQVSEYERLVERIREQVEAYQIEARTLGMTAGEAERFKIEQELLNAAIKSGIPITDQLIERNRKIAGTLIDWKEQAEQVKKAQDALNQAQDLISATWVRSFEEMILSAKSLEDAVKSIGDAWSKASLDALLTGKGPLAQFTGLASNDPDNPNAVGGIFGLLMGNQNKLFAELPKKVGAAAEAGTQIGSYDGTKTGAFEANVASGMTAFMQQYGKQIMGVGAGLTSLVGAYGVGAAGGSPGMAGLGGAISGVTGGLSLATGLSMSAAMMGPMAGIGAAIGAGVSLYANQQAKKQAKAERMAQAQAAYQDAIPQIQSFTKALSGEITGSLQQTIDEVHQKANELGKVAFFAYQFDEVKRIENEFNAYVERTKAEFRDGYQGMLDQLSVGGGMGGAFASAQNEMKAFGEELRGWTHDVATAFDWDLSVNHQAVMAAREAALAMLEPVESLSAVQSAIQQINGRASGLSDVLTKLGMSSEDAARAIDDGVGRAMDALRSTFSDDLTAKLNEVEGKDYLNEARDAIAQMQQMYADAAALGLDEGERIWRYFGRTAQEIVNGAELTGDAFNELITKFPEMSGVVHEFVAAMDGALQSAADFNASVQAKIFGAEGKSYITTAMDLVKERDALRDMAEKVGGDMALVETYYSKAAQSIVDSSQLTGDAFAELLAWAPELNGHVNAFAAAVQNMGQTAGEFYESMIDKVLGAQGKGYISDMRALITERDELMATAQQLGADLGLVNQYFDLTAQNIVNNAQLTGEKFTDLLAWFPELSGQLTEFAAAAQQVGDTFWSVQNNIIDKIVQAQGKGYIVDMRNLIREREELTATAQQVGVDVGLVNQYFSLAAQGIVDSAGLTGAAFSDLLAWFPDLAGALREAGQGVEQTAVQIEAAARRLRGYEDRFFNATNDNSSLDGALRAFDRQASADRAAELAAGGQHLVALERAIAAERLGVQAQFAAQAVSAAESAVAAAQQNLQRAAQAAIDAAQAQVQAAQTAAQAAAQAVSEAQSRVDAAQRNLERAQDAVRQGYEDQASVLRETVSRLQSFIKSINDFKRSLVLDDALSPYSPQQRLAEAQRQFQEISARAMGGDQDALDQLERVSRDYLSEARSYYASSEAYYQAFNDVQSILDQASRTAQSQLSEAEQQLAALEAQIAALTRIDDTVMSIDQAQAELNAAVADLATAQQQQAQADSALSVAQANLDAVQSQMDALLGIDQSVMSVEQAVRELAGAQDALAAAQRVQNDILAQQAAIASANPNELFVQQAYRDVFNREADPGGLQYWANQMDVGAATAAQVLERMQWEKAHGAMRMGGIVGSYATGGMVGNGTWDVDSVLARYAGGGNIALAGGEFVTRAPSVNRDTLPTLAAINATGRAPANDDSARNEIRALRQEVAGLKNELKQVLAAGFGATVGAVQTNTSAVRGTTDAVTRHRMARP